MRLSGLHMLRRKGLDGTRATTDSRNVSGGLKRLKRGRLSTDCAWSAAYRALGAMRAGFRRGLALMWIHRRNIGIFMVIYILFSLSLALKVGLFSTTAIVEMDRYLILPGVIRRGINHVGQTNTALHTFRWLGGRPSYESWNHARLYYESQRDIVLANAISTPLSRSFEAVGAELWDGASFYDMISQRAKVMLSNWKAHGWTDFKIEKDKCAMYRFIEQNGFPTCKVLAYWSDVEAFVREAPAVRDKHCSNNLCFFKMCHITMGHLNSAISVKPSSDWQQYPSWAKSLWNTMPVDWDRTWGVYFNKLTDTVKPGVFMQMGYKGGRGKNDSPVELKVEVVWGRAYLAFVTMGSHGCGSNPILLRDGSVMKLDIKKYFGAEEPDPCHQWLFDQGHMDVAWRLAELFARATQLDSVRVDIFVQKGGDPRDAVINEISLSSGAGYAWHWEFFSKVWREGYEARVAAKNMSVFAPPPHVSIETINHGVSYYPVVLAQCDASLLPSRMFAKFCS